MNRSVIPAHRAAISTVLFVMLLASCASPGEPTSSSGFNLVSTAFADGEEIPVRHAFKSGNQCSGDNISPGLTWSGTPPGSQSFALTVIDPDGGDWVHWLLFDIPADVASLSETESGPQVGTRGTNSFGQPGWGGPCPPSGTHRYVFTLYALDTQVNLPEGAVLDDLLQAMNGHILAQAVLTGLHSAP